MAVAVKHNLNHPFPTLGNGTATSGKTNIFDFDLPPNPVDAVTRPKIYIVYVICGSIGLIVNDRVIPGLSFRTES